MIHNLGGWPVTLTDWGNPGGSGVKRSGPPSLETLLATMKRNFTLGAMLEEWIGPDDRHSQNHVVQIDQMQLGLPSRDYFLHQESQKDLEAYHRYMTDVAVILGAEQQEAERQLWQVIEFEQQLANVRYHRYHLALLILILKSHHHQKTLTVYITCSSDVIALQREKK